MGRQSGPLAARAEFSPRIVGTGKQLSETSSRTLRNLMPTGGATSRMRGIKIYNAIFTFVPLILAWVLFCIIVGLTRWVVAGFRQG